MYLFKSDRSVDETGDTVVFSGNSGTYGGAVFIADYTNTGACLPMIECFFQILATYRQISQSRELDSQNIVFSDNIAEYGSSLFGGLLDRCIPSPLAEVFHGHKSPYRGVTYLRSISNITIDAIASLPVRICFCNSKGQPDCDFHLPMVKVKKGETFTIALVAVDQVNHSIQANVTTSTGSVLGEHQRTREVKSTCTDLVFNVFSSKESETLTLFANGPCGSVPLSAQQVNIKFLNCTCPIGFEPSSRKTSTCECNCDSSLFPYITICNSAANSLLRLSTNS